MTVARVISLSSDSVPCEFATRLAVDAGYAVVKLEPAGGDALRARRGRFADWLLAGKQSITHGVGGLNDVALATLLRSSAAVVCDAAGRSWLNTILGRDFDHAIVVVGERDASALLNLPAARSDEFLAFHGSGLGFITPRVMPGYPSAGPLCPAANLLEFLTGLYGAIALFALLGAHQRDAADPADAGRAASASAGLCAAALPLLRREIAAVLLEGAAPHRAERIWKVSPAEVHRCRDGWLFVDVIEDIQWTRLAHWMGKPELGDDARYTTRESRFAHAETLCAILDEFFADRPQACWIEAQAQGVPIAPVNALSDLVADPQLAARGFWGMIAAADGTLLRAPLSPLARLFNSAKAHDNSSNAPLSVHTPGQDNDALIVEAR